MGSRDYSSSIVTNSRYDSDSIGNNRSSLHLNNFYFRNNWSCCIDNLLSLCFVPGWSLGFRRAVNTSGW